MMTRRELVKLVAGGAVGVGAAGVGWLTCRHTAPAPVPLDDGTLSALTSLAIGIGVSRPSTSRLAALQHHITELPAASPLLAAEYREFCAALRRASAAEAVSVDDWREAETATRVLTRYFRETSAAASVRYADRVISASDVALKDMLLFLEGERTGRITQGRFPDPDAAAVPVGTQAASHAFSTHCSACHQATDLLGVDSRAVKAAIEGETVMSTWTDLRRLNDDDIRQVVAFLNR
jgi:hypothetical protein